MSVPLPTPEGPVMTRTRGGAMATGRLAAEVRDQLVALALGETADGLARRDPALREDAIDLHAAVLRNRQEQVEDLRSLQIFRRIQEQSVDLRAARLEIALEAGSPRPDLVGALESVHPLGERTFGCHPRGSFRGRLRGRRHGRRCYTEMNE